MLHTSRLNGMCLTRVWLVTLVLLFALAIGQAAGQEVVLKNIHYYQQPADGSGLFGSWGSEAIGHLGFYFGSHADYASQPLEWTDPEGATHILIYDQTVMQMSAGFGIFSVINVSATLPMGIARTFNEEFNGKQPYIDQDTGETEFRELDKKWESFALGDARIQGKYIFRNRRYDQWGLAAMVEMGLPTGDAVQFLSDEQWTVSPRAIFDIGNTWWTYVLNIAYKYYPEQLEAGLFDIAGGNELIVSTGATFRFLWGLEAIAEFQTRTLLEEFYSNENIDYGEGLFGLRSTWGVNNPFRVTLGSGVGALDGVGTPIWRAFLGVDVFVRALGLP